jgi:uncharacterized delta-60 repeat protein
LGLAFVIALLLAVSVAAGGGHGSLDRSFGRGGKVTTAMSPGGAGVFAVAIQSGGKLVAAGSSGQEPNNVWALARYLANGRLDPSFGTGGKVTTQFGQTVFALAIQEDGKIVAGGTGGASRYVLARYSPNGTLDRSFGTGGTVTTFSPGVDALAIQKDGKIVAAGGGDKASNQVFALARYNPNGTLDRSFGTGGKVTTAIGTDAVPLDLVIQPDGKLVAAGWGGDLSQVGFALARYRADGTLDPSFGRGGKVTTAFGSLAEGHALVIQPDGKIVAAGEKGAAPSTFALARYNPNGTLDRSFGRGGKVTTTIASDRGVSDLVIQPDGKLVAAGSRVEAGSINYDTGPVLVRYNPNGTLDRSFGTGGTVTTIGPVPTAAVALAIQKDGKLVAGGDSTIRSHPVFALWRYLP